VSAVIPDLARNFRSHLCRPVVAATLLAAVLHLSWALFVANDAGDLAAQYAWTDFAVKHPGSAYNLSWYGGMHPASYSLVSPYLMGWLGVRTTAVITGTLSAALAALLLVRSGVRKPLVPALWASIAIWCDIAAGRVTFALGMVFVLLCVLLLFGGGSVRARRIIAAAVVGVVATMFSPVAGLFIEVVAAALFFSLRRRDAMILAAGPPLVIGTTSLLFPFYGVQPFDWYAAVLTSAAAVVIAVLVPGDWRAVRAGAWVYACGVAACWVVPSPIGSNVERLVLLLGAVVLLCAALAPTTRGWRKIVAYAAFAAVAGWTVGGSVVDMVNTDPVATTIAHAPPLIDELVRVGANRTRVEVVPLRSHWEAAGVAPYVNLARGWNRQADVERNPLFYDGSLTPATYHSWLLDWSVGYVVLSADQLDGSGVAEGRIVGSGNSWLTLVWQDPHWRIYRVSDAEPLADPPATVTFAGPAQIVVEVPQGGSVVLKVAWSPWLGIDGIRGGDPASGCLAPDGKWTRLYVPTPGTYTIEARYALTRGTPCAVDDDR
jgi:hypothetical protein